MQVLRAGSGPVSLLHGAPSILHLALHKDIPECSPNKGILLIQIIIICPACVRDRQGNIQLLNSLLCAKIEVSIRTLG